MSVWALRAATRADHAPLLDLWVEAWTEAMPAIDFEARRPWFAGHLDGLESAGTLTVLAEGDGGIAGFVTVDPSARYLDQLAIRPAQRGSGLAQALLDHAKALAGERLDLHVNQDNARALRFYEREGFRRLAAGINPRSGLPVWHMRWGA